MHFLSAVLDVLLWTICAVWKMIYPPPQLVTLAKLTIIGQTNQIEPKCVTGILGVSPKHDAFPNYYSPSPSGDQLWSVRTVWTTHIRGMFHNFR
jgi:hypothetical protein